MDWTSASKLIDRADHILLTTHENPDGDGLGSASAMYHYLKAEGKDCRIINCSPLPEEYLFLDMDSIFEKYDPDSSNDWFLKCDLAIIFDVGDFDRIREIKNEIINNKIQTLNIDHHPYPNDHPFTYNIVDTSAAATGVLIYDFVVNYRNHSLSRKIGEGIYTAVLTDTGSFRYSNTDAKCHEIAIACLDAGVETSKIYQDIYETRPASGVHLLARVIDNIRYENDGELAWFIIDQSMLNSTGARSKDVDGFTDFVRTIKGVEVSLMIFENVSEKCRVNFRSKGKYVINEIANHFGGGGHKFAAGAVISGTKEDIAQKVVAETKISIEKQST